MDGIQGLVSAIRNAVDKRIKQEARALRGTIKNGMFQCGAKTFPFVQAVDCNTSGKVWAQLSSNDTAVIVGA